MSTYSIDHLTPVQKTLLITVKGRAADSKQSDSILRDGVADDLITRLEYDLSTVKLGAGVQDGIAIRSRVLDRSVADFVAVHPNAVVVELGAGLETRIFRVRPPSTVSWYDVDFPEVIELRRGVIPHRDNMHPVGVSLLDPDWVKVIPPDRPTLLVADGLIGFLIEDEIRTILTRITAHFNNGELVTNAYAPATARLTRHYTKSVGIPKGFRGYGFGDPQHLSHLNPNLRFIDEQTLGSVPESKHLSGAVRFNARVLAHFPVIARRSLWILRYRF